MLQFTLRSAIGSVSFDILMLSLPGGLTIILFFVALALSAHFLGEGKTTTVE